MSRYSNVADVSMRQTVGGPGMDMRVQFLCEGKGPRVSGHWKGGIPIRCLRCVKCEGAALKGISAAATDTKAATP